jgi:hypothetical protein
MCIMTGFNTPVARQPENMWRQLTSPFVKRARAIALCGLTPQKLALTLCLGIAFGIIPLVWGTSLVCFALAHALGLNHVALQSVNYLLLPVHLALLFPFFKIGATLLPWGPPLPAHLIATLLHHPGQFTLNILGWLTLKALVIWLVTAIPVALVLYMILRATVFRETILIPNQ